MSLLSVDESKCTKCGICAKVCLYGIIEPGDFGFPQIDEKKEGRCIECGHCVLFCPASANELSFMKADGLTAAADIEMPSQNAALNLIKTRRSIRNFKKEVLPRDTFDRIFNAVSQAPTAVNLQPVRWVVTETPEKTAEAANLALCWFREIISSDPISPLAVLGAALIARAKAGEDAILRGAPHLAVAVVPKGHKRPEDGVIALTYLELAAHALGVGCCWGGYFMNAARNFAPLREFMGIKEDEFICGAQMMGLPALLPSRQYPARRRADISWL